MDPAQITVVCLFKAKQNTKQLVRQELLNLAKLTRKENGCINYDPHVSTSDDTLFILYENWENQSSLDTHMNQPHLKAWLAKSKQLLESRDIKICTRIN